MAFLVILVMDLKIKIESLKLIKKNIMSHLLMKKKINNFEFKVLNSKNHILVIGDSIASDVVLALNTQNIKSERYNLTVLVLEN